ncbi:hypothetical protein JW964_20870 [candidate division KSB1 bacterium]|nr:hypothetical protein [candidate division KSB1 bacterium]
MNNILLIAKRRGMHSHAGAWERGKGLSGWWHWASGFWLLAGHISNLCLVPTLRRGNAFLTFHVLITA